jgi:hypothetical protein
MIPLYIDWLYTERPGVGLRHDARVHVAHELDYFVCGVAEHCRNNILAAVCHEVTLALLDGANKDTQRTPLYLPIGIMNAVMSPMYESCLLYMSHVSYI